ncbi:hypothetical protein MTBBW1_1670100 [Desulfamplus magnetovallimortis]|uniref:Uncharacterized protein n=1 Tax=Desulfamplus magnetovallimortis TaxID=1246637 RepID=A0A1W1H9G7_9BACT|nr:hypothetical protein MTBBW1_1670100 [Desulfamplus magnetovallimortis]
METTDSIFQRIESTICGGGFEKLGLLSMVKNNLKRSWLMISHPRIWKFVSISTVK